MKQGFEGKEGIRRKGNFREKMGRKREFLGKEFGEEKGNVIQLEKSKRI